MTKADKPAVRHTGPGTDEDVIALLVEQHRRVQHLLDRVSATEGETRQQAFDQLRELLARHETAEEMIVRPITRRLPGGASIADGRMDEENAAKQDLADLEKVDVNGVDFTAMFERFKAAVLAHANAEEQQEFVLLRGSAGTETLIAARTKLERAEATAPTHPHPSADSTMKNYLVGPFAAMVDHARDLIRKAS